MAAELTYPEVGATAGRLPDGYHHVHESAVIGNGPEDLDVAANTLLTWDMNRRCGVRVLTAPSRAEVGRDVEMRWLGQKIRCRVVEVVDEPHRQGFTYGTLPGHPERGEERFIVSLEPQSGEVTATITAFSRPATWTARAAGPIGRLVQGWMTRRYLRALRPTVAGA